MEVNGYNQLCAYNHLSKYLLHHHNTSIIFVFTIGSRGRPSLNVTREQLGLLLKHGFKAKAMARMLGCSTSYMYHKLQALGIRMRDQFTQIDDNVLEQHVQRLHQQYPKSGYKVCLDIYSMTCQILLFILKYRVPLRDIL